VYKLGITVRIISELGKRKWQLEKKEEICSSYLFQLLHGMEDGESSRSWKLKYSTKARAARRQLPLICKVRKSNCIELLY
jgi:hypothetical protein